NNQLAPGFRWCVESSHLYSLVALSRDWTEFVDDHDCSRTQDSRNLSLRLQNVNETARRLTCFSAPFSSARTGYNRALPAPSGASATLTSVTAAGTPRAAHRMCL